MAENEDLEFNPFYQTLQSQYLGMYEQAQQDCWLVCIPQASSLSGCTINKQFIDMHLLEPSLMWKDRYDSNVGGQRVSWLLEGHQLVCAKNECKVKATVLSEELGYNRSLQQFKIFVLDRPLDPNYTPSVTAIALHDSLKVKRTYHEQKMFLLSFSQHKQPLSDLNTKIFTFFESYMIVETLLSDTASKLKAIAHHAATSFMTANKEDERMDDRRIREVVWMAVEGVLLCSVHSKVYPAVCSLHKNQEEVFNKRCHLLRGKLTTQFLSLSNDFQGEYHKTVKELNKLDSIESPLDGLYTFQDALDKIVEDVRDNFRASFRLGDPPPLASDDLIALLASIIVRTDCRHLLSSLYYMEHFHWSLSESDKLSFSLVTLRAAVEYLKGPEVNSLLPRSEAPQRKPPPAKPWETLPPPSKDSWDSPSSVATPTLALEDRKNTVHPPPVVEAKKDKKSDLGPFLSMLMNSETVSSSSFYSGDS